MADPAVIASWVGAALIAVLLILAEHRVKRSKGRNLLYHAIFAGVVAFCLLFLPEEFQFALFSPLGVVVVGTVFPIYESIRAVCTPGGDDDKAWLQYWIAQGIISYSTAWVDDVADTNPGVREHWYEFEFFFYLWLLLPFTDGSTLLFDFITKPLITPWVKPIAEKMDNWIANVVSLVVSASHLWFLWMIFVFLDPRLKRFVTVAVGVAYPLLASIVAVTTEIYDDDTFWLTYWSCYGILYLIMDLLETWLGSVPGFYTLVLFTTVYLMLPLFRGAEKLFRHVLVPLSGLQEMLILRDSLALKKEMLRTLPEHRAKEVKKVLAASFAKDNDDDDDEPLIRACTNYQSVPPAENTPLIV